MKTNMKTKKLLAAALCCAVAALCLFPAAAASGSPSAWAAEQVNRAISEGLVPQNLQSDYTKAITRAEFCALAVLLYEKHMGTISELAPAFDDSRDTNVRKMSALGVVNGVGDNRFNPNGKLIREQAAAILSRLADAMGISLAKASPDYTDSKQISDWAAADVGKMQASKIMTGTDGNRFDPKGSYTREQSIVTMVRIWDMVKKSAETFPFPYKFTAKDLYGNTVTEKSLGEKELFFVHYWATWCGPCVNEMPELAKIAEEYGDRVGFLALLADYGSAAKTAIRIAESSGISFVMVDANTKELQELLKKVQSGYVPTTILIDGEGNIVGEQIIGSYGSGYASYIDEALEK